MTDTVLNAMQDALSGWRYIRTAHGDLYGVGWDRVETGLAQAIEARRAETGTGSVHESPVPQECAPTPTNQDNNHD